MSLEKIRKLRESSEKELSHFIGHELICIGESLRNGHITLLSAHKEFCKLKTNFDGAVSIIENYSLILEKLTGKKELNSVEHNE